MAANEAHDRAVARERYVIHQAAHQKDAESASPVVGLDARALGRCWETVAAVSDLDRKLASIERAVDGESPRARRAAVLDGVAQSFAGRQPNVRDRFVREPTDARETGDAFTGQRHVPDVTGESCSVLRAHGRPLTKRSRVSGIPKPARRRRRDCGRREQVKRLETWEAKCQRRGRLAQLGERLPYKEEVGGSSPSSPILQLLVALGVWCSPQMHRYARLA
jgi:hypothetical protein